MTDNELNTTPSAELDLADIIEMLWKHKFALVLFAVICSALMFVRTQFFVHDTYTSYGVLHISNKTERVERDTVIEKNDIETSKTLSTTYMEVLKTRIFLKDISNAVYGKYTGDEILKMINISTVNDTELLKISVKALNAYDAYAIAEAITQKAPDKLTSVYKSGEVEIVDPPVKPQNPDPKGYAKNTAAGFMIGLMIGFAYAFVYDFFDKKVHKASDISKRFGISVLGETAQNIKNGKKGNKKKIRIPEVQKIISSDTDFDTAETYKSIRTNIMFSMPKTDGGKVIVVTGALPEEGKTTTTVNLAITFAQTGAKTVLVDCDLRKSRVHRYLQIERDRGVTNVVCGFLSLDDAIKKNVRQNLDCLTAGEVPPNPAELLQTDEFKNMICALKQQYDYIFIDTPPVTFVTDAAILAKDCSGVVVVARCEFTTYDLLDSAIEELNKSGAKILGVIVHDCAAKYKKYGYYKAYK